MDKQNNKIWHSIQIAIFLIMAALALSCGSSKSSSSGSSSSYNSSDAYRAFRAGAQAAFCSGSGFVMVGSASSESACASLCERRGYRNQYCLSPDTGTCFCK